jgi:hypothetical protein
MLSDESGILKNFGGRYSNGIPNLDLLLKCWSGEPYRKDRCGGAPVVLQEPYLSVCLCAQPYIVSNLMNNEAFRSSGLTARFLYTYPKSLVGKREYDTPDIPTNVKDSYHKIVYSAFNSKVVFKKRNVLLTLSNEAVKQFVSYYNTSIEPQLKDKFAECPDWGGKFHGLILRLCGIIHCMLTFSEDKLPENEYVSVSTQNNHDGEIQQAEYILRKLISKQVREITPRDLLHICRSFRTMEEMKAPVELLLEHGYLSLGTPAYSGAGRKAKTTFLVNPLILS